MSSEMVVHHNGAARDLTPEQVQLIKNTLTKDLSNDELSLFIATCNRLHLDPFAKQAYAIKRGGRMQVQVSIDGFRLVAERTQGYQGQSGPFWCGPDGKWVDVWLQRTPPAAAKVGVYRAGFTEPLWGTATWDAYNQANNPIWAKMGAHMLAKCAESLALRRAFPHLSGIYSPEEMGQAEDVKPWPSKANKGRTLDDVMEPEREKVTGSAVKDEPEAQPSLALPPSDSDLAAEEAFNLAAERAAADMIDRIGRVANEHELKNWWKKHAGEIKALPPQMNALVTDAKDRKKAAFGWR